MDDGDKTRQSLREHLQAGVADEYADYDFRSAVEVFGADGADLVAWWARALAERASIHPDHYQDAADQVIVEFATTPQRTLHYGFNGSETWIEDWGTSLDDARDYLAHSVRDFAGQIKAERGYGGGHHPWDDPSDA